MQCAVLGSPIAHSLSPAMHRAAYAALGLDWTYSAIEIAEGDLRAFVNALGDDVRGLSVTAPLKREAVEVAHHLSSDAEALGVANTLVVDDGALSGHNTDVPGARLALESRGITSVETVRIVGGGATATSMAYALAQAGMSHLELFVRDPERARGARRIAERQGVEVVVRKIEEPLVDKVDLLVSTVPGEAIGSRSHELIESSRAVFDVVYDPWPTGLMEAADSESVPVVTGIDLLAAQAALQVELMTGSTVRPQLLRDAALAELDAR